jgi:hypothetical protein
MTRRKRSRWWTPFLFYRESADAHVTARIVWWVIAATMPKRFGEAYVAEASSLFLHVGVVSERWERDFDLLIYNWGHALTGQPL